MKHLPSPISYREDINGLRAWAVIAVLFFHFKLPGVSAGFIGVDMFFVISGFLMTAIIVKGLERSNFSIWAFYRARIRRILPALMALIAVLLVLGWFWLPTPDYQSLGVQSGTSLGFLSNIYYWRSAGYFDVASQEKWLLHTWSLGIEAQFYLLFPIYLMLIWKIKPHINTLFWGLILAFIASLTLSIVVSSFKPTAAFYLLPTRGWELAAGGLAFLIGREVSALHKFAKPMFWTGVLLWLVSVFLLGSHFAWPSGWALFPVLGTVLIILAQQSNSKLLVNPVAQWLGDRSYSLYLWHWPLMVALYFVGLQNEWLWVAAAITASFVLAHLSYRLVEVPTRTYLSTAGVRREIFAIGLAGLVIGGAAVAVKYVGFDSRMSYQVDLAANESQNKHADRQKCHASAGLSGSPGCVHGGTQVKAYLLGDSHANSVASGFGLAAKNFNSGIVEWSFSGCPPLLGVMFPKWREVFPSNKCALFNDWAMSQLIKSDSGLPIVLLGRLSANIYGRNPGEEGPSHEPNNVPRIFFREEYKSSFDVKFEKEFIEAVVKTACSFSSTRDVYLVRPIPEMGVDVPKTLSRKFLFGRGNDDIKITLKEYHQRHKLVWQAQDQAAEQCGVKILNPLPYLCDDEYCYGSKNGRPLYYDDDHLSEYGNKYLVPMFEEVFRDQLLAPK